MRRAGVLFLCLALGYGRPAAAAFDIPAKYLEAEARITAAMSPKARAHFTSLTNQLSTKMTVADVKKLGSGADPATLFALMMEYLKIMQKEAREEKRLAREAAKLELSTKSAKLDLEKKKIGEMRTEAGERFDHAMQAANLEMMLGVTSSAAAVSSATGATSFRSPTPTRTPALHPAPETGVRIR